MNWGNKQPIITLILAELGDEKSAVKSLNYLASTLESDCSLPVYFRNSYAEHLKRIAATEPLSLFRPPGKRHAKNLRTKLETYFKVEEIIAENESNGASISKEEAIAEFYERERKCRACRENTFHTHYYAGQKIFNDQLKKRGSDIFEWTLPSPELEGGKSIDT